MTAKECGGFIQTLRKEKNLTQKQLAQAINVSDKAVSRWETGKGYPDISSLIALSAFFDVSVNELIAGGPIPEEKIPEFADTNLINAIAEKEKTKKNCIVQIMICIFLFILIFFPVLFLTGNELIEQLKLCASGESVRDSLIMILVSAFMEISGALISKGHITLLHSYHYRNVTDREGYCKAIGRATMSLGIPFFTSSVMMLFESIHIISVLSSVILIGGSAVVFIMIFKIQMKYNGGIF